MRREGRSRKPKSARSSASSASVRKWRASTCTFGSTRYHASHTVLLPFPLPVLRFEAEKRQDRPIGNQPRQDERPLPAQQQHQQPAQPPPQLQPSPPASRQPSNRGRHNDLFGPPSGRSARGPNGIFGASGSVGDAHEQGFQPAPSLSPRRPMPHPESRDRANASVGRQSFQGPPMLRAPRGPPVQTPNRRVALPVSPVVSPRHAPQQAAHHGSGDAALTSELERLRHEKRVRSTRLYLLRLAAHLVTRYVPLLAHTHTQHAQMADLHVEEMKRVAEEASHQRQAAEEEMARLRAEMSAKQADYQFELALERAAQRTVPDSPPPQRPRTSELLDGSMMLDASLAGESNFVKLAGASMGGADASIMLAGAAVNQSLQSLPEDGMLDVTSGTLDPAIKLGMQFAARGSGVTPGDDKDLELWVEADTFGDDHEDVGALMEQLGLPAELGGERGFQAARNRRHSEASLPGNTEVQDYDEEAEAKRVAAARAEMGNHHSGTGRLQTAGSLQNSSRLLYVVVSSCAPTDPMACNG